MQYIGFQKPTIATTLKLQKWKTFYESLEDVKKG